MNGAERKRLEARGWKVGGVDEFLGLTAEELTVIDLKIALAAFLREQRLRAGLTQAELARRIGSSQPRVAKMEGFDHEVSIDLLLRAVFACGVGVRGVGKLIESAGKERTAAPTVRAKGARRSAPKARKTA